MRHKNIDYSNTRFKNINDLFDCYVDISDYHFDQDQYLERIKNGLLDQLNIERASPELIKERELEILCFKNELEKILKNYDPEKTRIFNKSLKNFHSFNKTSLEKNIQIWELIYLYVFNDQADFRPELIQTPIGTLKEGKYI